MKENVINFFRNSSIDSTGEMFFLQLSLLIMHKSMQDIVILNCDFMTYVLYSPTLSKGNGYYTSSSCSWGEICIPLGEW